MSSPIRVDVPFSMVPEWVIEAEISSHAVRLYAALMRYASLPNGALPSRQTLAERFMHVSLDTLDRALKELIRIGAVEVEPRAGKTNAYVIVTHRTRAATPSDHPGEGMAAPVRKGRAAPVPNERKIENKKDLSVPSERPTQAVVGAYIEIYTSVTGASPPARVKGQMARQIKQLLDEGVKPGDVALACGLLVEKRLHPSTLPTLLLEVQAGPKQTRRTGAKKFGYGMTTADMMEAAQRQKEASDGKARVNGTGGVVQRSLPQPGS